MGSHFWWYTARACGLVAWGLVVASCAWGLMLALRVKVLGIRPTAAWTLSLHRWLSALAVTFTAVHVLAILADDFVGFSVGDVLVPFATSWHPVAVAWGIASMYLLVAIEITSLLRARLSYRAWRGLHLCSYVLLGATTIHLLTAGTDSTTVIPEAIAVVLGMFAVFSTVMLLTWRAAPKPRRIIITGDGQGRTVDR
ncbi:MAG: ferric reductase-like transmembrane domain-containing protein [Acidimicrobiia bacterium]